MLIDCHVHIGKSEKFKIHYSLSDYLRQMPQWGVDAAVIMPNISSVISTDQLNAEFLESLAELRRDQRTMLFPLLLADPNCPATLDQIRTNRATVFGIKYHPSVCQKRIVDVELQPFLEYCDQEQMIALIHSGRHIVSHSSFVFRVASSYPRIRFVVAHLGGNASDLVEATLQDVQTNHAALDNVYLDTSAAKMPYLVSSAVRVMSSQRVLFGSDIPYADFRIGRYCVELADLTDREKALVYSQNVSEILAVANPSAFTCYNSLTLKSSGCRK
jgi:predicted TIM-barrel fold metal-dependent hydrolase